MSLAGKCAIVTGGARGLGAVIASGLVTAGMRVAVLDIRDIEGEALASELGAACRFYSCDVALAEQVELCFEAAATWLGGLDVFVAVAGIDRPGYKTGEIPVEIWDEIMGVNARGTFLCNQAAFRLMKERGGRIINFGSFAGVRGIKERAAYSASKAAVFGWTRAAAQSWGEFGITVNAVAPLMRSKVAERYLSKLSSEDRDAYFTSLKQRVPIGGRLGEPESDLLPLILFLADDGSQYITGQIFSADGGMTMLGS